MNNNKILQVVLSLVVILVIALGVMFGYRAYINRNVEKGNKEITVKVVVNNEVKKEVTFRTDAKFLGKALDEIKLIETQDTQFGRYVVSVNGISADISKEEWWKVLINNQDSTVGVDDQSIKDKDIITFEFTVGFNY